MSELVTTNRTLSTMARTPDTIAAEIRALTASMLSNVLEIGRRMCEVKEMLPHGSFGDWIRDNTGYSPSTANNFMRLFREYGAEQGSLFGTDVNCQTFGNLSYSKALALLNVPAEDREEFVKDHDVEAMSTRELQQAIQERDKARAEAEEARQEAEGAALAAVSWRTSWRRPGPVSKIWSWRRRKPPVRPGKRRRPQMPSRRSWSS